MIKEQHHKDLDNIANRTQLRRKVVTIIALRAPSLSYGSIRTLDKHLRSNNNSTVMVNETKQVC